MMISERLKDLREAKHLSQGDIEKRTGLLRCYLSRVENGHTVPAIETLEKMARALEVPMYQLFYEGEEPPRLLPPVAANGDQWGTTGQTRKYLLKLRRALARMQPEDRRILLSVTRKLTSRTRSE